jgi:hypothetical protein
MKIYGYSYLSVDIIPSPIELDHKQAVIRFIKDNLNAAQLIITDAGDNQLLLMRDGLDLFNDLDRIGISLQAVLNHIREEMVDEGSSRREKPKWEQLYDQIGLSPGEICMRQRVKAACRAAKTVADVAEVVRGTYFDAHFQTTDGNKWYRFFDEEDYSATLMIKDENGNWIDEPEKAVLSPDIMVRHLRSSEDVHTFELVD